MDAISATAAQVQEQQAPSSLSAANTALGKEDFLTLLVAQLQNQDPLNPADPTEFTAQLAQFSSLEQLFTVNDRLEELSSANAQMEKYSTLSLIGKMIAVAGDSFSLEQDGQAISLGYGLEGNASNVTLQIQDQTGGIVALIPGTETSAGQHFVTWDGTGLNGEPLPAGDYRLVVSALDATGQGMNASPLVSLKVQGVDLTSPVTTLNTAAGDFPMSQVLGVRVAEESTSSALEEQTAEEQQADGSDAATAAATDPEAITEEIITEAVS